MQFSTESDITLVVTSCGRLDLLKRTLESFDRFNTAPVREVFITEDAGDEGVRAVIPAHWKEHSTFFVNRPKLGQLASIDLAYGHVKTPYIFHCEDDWEFYRPGFVEDSRTILELRPEILQVWLRNYVYDLCVHSPYIHLGTRELIGGVACYPLISDKPEWQSFSLNPGLRRLKEYRLCAPFAAHGGEKALSQRYAGLNLTAVTLEGDAVLHTGFGVHVEVPAERQRKARRSRREQIKLALALLLGVCIGWFIK
ncbi:glycosyltransferase family 2 protein [Pseudomonas sp. 6D_7.1_Bac1]|uniref:glycosyltransferase family 2 protein n=1 Tax=Pseudomonas sp. 6D_7.1_Bac1 TaxID=2971615 RepID=UPI0021C9D81B|nr:glycosyltransferase family 2 protein [Pseudomonas sp. 6D_7.1_Bac1]MCU1750757.1 glycosyltransferase family 2 protein [Pseudomonas sp. 6D_7.1_Bac1]